MRRPYVQGICWLACLITAMTSGCLSLGTRTTYVQETPESAARMATLEARVTALERALGTDVATPADAP